MGDIFVKKKPQTLKRKNTMEIYIYIGLLYSLLLLIRNWFFNPNPNKESWVGILLIGTLLWPIDLVLEQIVERKLDNPNPKNGQNYG